MFRFRRMFTSGPFRTTWTGRGIGWSFGVPGFRLGFSGRGIVLTVGIPGTGFYFVKRLFGREP